MCTQKCFAKRDGTLKSWVSSLLLAVTIIWIGLGCIRRYLNPCWVWCSSRHRPIAVIFVTSWRPPQHDFLFVEITGILFLKTSLYCRWLAILSPYQVCEHNIKHYFNLIINGCTYKYAISTLLGLLTTVNIILCVGSKCNISYMINRWILFDIICTRNWNEL